MIGPDKRANFLFLTTLGAVIISIVLMILLVEKVNPTVVFDKKSNIPVFVYIVAVVLAAYAGLTAVYFSRVRRINDLMVSQNVGIDMEENDKRVLILYNNADLDFAKNLNQKLKDFGYRTWFNNDDVLPGQSTSYAKFSGSYNSALAVVIISNNFSINDDYVMKLNIENILKKKHDVSYFSRVLPVLIDGAELPDFLSDIVPLKFDNENFSEVLDKSIRAMIRD
jgi:hypothetical protein